METIFHWISQYGYVGLFGALVLGIAGLPIPDETILTFCGYLVSVGRLNLVLTLATGIGGSMCGITGSYLIGRTLGYPFIHRYGHYIHLTEERMDRVHRMFERTGHWLLTFGYYVPGVRHFTAIVAGVSRLEYPVFARYAYPGACIWVASFLGLGYLVGEHWRQAFDTVHHYLLLACLIVVIAIAAILLWRRVRKR